MSESNIRKSNNPEQTEQATRACFYCQKAHLTCDDSRPCQRCIKRDLAATCTDGIRKKAKYLQDSSYNAYELDHQFYYNNELYSINQQNQQHHHNDNNNFQPPLTPTSTQPPTPLQHPRPNPSLNHNEHYHPLSPLIDNRSFPSHSPNIDDEIHKISPIFSPPIQNQKPLNQQNQQILVSSYLVTTQPSQQPSQQPVFMHNGFNTNPAASITNNIVDTSTLFGSGSYPIQTANYGFGSETINLEYSVLGNMLSASTTTEALSPHTAFADISFKKDNLGKKISNSLTLENVYANVDKPFSYTEGFHYLVKWIRERMDKEHIDRIVKALATFRPSFIALIMNLTEDDLIFMEKCFQRTILEFEKLIGFSGTPTVVWRRTGEIALVGKEFTLLTKWTKEQLLGKKTYIYEVMDSKSAVEYWEKFAEHAFDNSRQSDMMTCILVGANGIQVQCTFCFTIKRDIFDIPLAIVGNLT
ncbi:10888_t:CDS:10 [Entrophospora sp. SA101]|nr:10888_t:CDS:10 [Entrophospora sp. SA101]